MSNSTSVLTIKSAIADLFDQNIDVQSSTSKNMLITNMVNGKIKMVEDLTSIPAIINNVGVELGFYKSLETLKNEVKDLASVISFSATSHIFEKQLKDIIAELEDLKVIDSDNIVRPISDSDIRDCLKPVITLPRKEVNRSTGKASIAKKLFEENINMEKSNFLKLLASQPQFDNVNSAQVARYWPVVKTHARAKGLI